MQEKYSSPLKWLLDWGPDEDGDYRYIASTPFGNYSVETYLGVWKWSFIFNEYYDEGGDECDDLERGKVAAQAHWDERVQPILVSAVKVQK